MRIVTPSDVLNYKPDLSVLREGHRTTEMSPMSEKIRSTDLALFTVPVWIVRIVNVDGVQVFSSRMAGNQADVEVEANELLNTFCRRYPSSFLSHSISLANR